MGVNIAGRSFLKLLDYTTEEIEYLLELSANFKNMKRAGVPHKYLEGKNIVLLFEKTSTRTRCAFEVGALDLGMGVTYLDLGSSQMGKKESIEDTARVLGRMYDGIEYRGFEQAKVEELAAKAGVPVWNGLTTEFHPTQVLADILTMLKSLERLRAGNLHFLVRRPETSLIRSWSFALSSALTTVLAAQSGEIRRGLHPMILNSLQNVVVLRPSMDRRLPLQRILRKALVMPM